MQQQKRIRLNTELRNKISNRMRLHLEQEDTQEKRKFDDLRFGFKELQDRLGHLLKLLLESNIHRKIWIRHITYKTNMKM